MSQQSLCCYVSGMQTDWLHWNSLWRLACTVNDVATTRSTNLDVKLKFVDTGFLFSRHQWQSSPWHKWFLTGVWTSNSDGSIVSEWPNNSVTPYRRTIWDWYRSCFSWTDTNLCTLGQRSNKSSYLFCEQDQVTVQVNALLALKKQYKELTGKDYVSGTPAAQQPKNEQVCVS